MRSLLPGLLAALLLTSAAHAAPLTIAFRGVVDNDPFGVFDSAGFEGSYTFDAALPQVLDTPQTGGYAGTGGIYGMRVSFTGTLDPSVAGPYVADGLDITLNDDFPGPLDQYLVTGTSSVDPALSILLTLEDFTATALSGTALPLAAPGLPLFASARFALFAGTLDNPVEAEGRLTRLEVCSDCAARVPEPGTLWLLLATGVIAWPLSRVVARSSSNL
jgi:hypothetical protein